eukprot:5371965-Prymnesium_polylepis.2
MNRAARVHHGRVGRGCQRRPPPRTVGGPGHRSKRVSARCRGKAHQREVLVRGDKQVVGRHHRHIATESCVCVLRVADDRVIVADDASGRRRSRAAAARGAAKSGGLAQWQRRPLMQRAAWHEGRVALVPREARRSSKQRELHLAHRSDAPVDELRRVDSAVQCEPLVAHVHVGVGGRGCAAAGERVQPRAQAHRQIRPRHDAGHFVDHQLGAEDAHGFDVRIGNGRPREDEACTRARGEGRERRRGEGSGCELAVDVHTV